jgi:hypothetical protein
LGTTFHHNIFVALSVGTSVEEKILKTFWGGNLQSLSTIMEGCY